jgi:hypothetical protein
MDGRHSAGKHGVGGKRFDIESLPKDIIRRLDKEQQRVKKKAAVARDNYFKDIKNFREKVLQEFEQKNVGNPKIGMYGSPEDASTDVLYIQYTLTEETDGKIAKMIKFLKKAFAKFNLENHFLSEPVGANEEADEVLDVGDVVYIMFLRDNHPYSKFKQQSIDYLEEPEEDDMGGF